MELKLLKGESAEAVQNTKFEDPPLPVEEPQDRPETKFETDFEVPVHHARRMVGI
jgi:hypothetical protein